MAADRRLGLGKLKHVSIRHIFVQGLVRTGHVTVVKTPTEADPADIATKALDQATILKHFEACGADVSKRAADIKEVLHFGRRAAEPAWSPAAAGLQSCFQGLAIWAATLST